MDEETKAAFANVTGQFADVKGQFADVTVQFEAMMARMNDGFERVLNEITTLRTDFQNTKGFLLEDAIVMGRRVLSIEDRLSALERKKP